MQVSVGGTVYLGGEIIVTASGTTLCGVPFGDFKPEDFVDDQRFLGRGVSGSVSRMIHRPTGQRIAVKQIRLLRAEFAMQHIKQELRTFFVAKQRGGGDAAYLIDCISAWAREEAVFIAMECMDGSLGAHGISPCPEPVAARIAMMVLRGLRFLHDEALLVHRDIKPGNLLYRLDGTVKITDFGLSSKLHDSDPQDHNYVGSVVYMSPQRVRGELYSVLSDVWSLGVTVAELVLGYHPFKEAMGDAYDEGHQARFWKLVQLYDNHCAAIEDLARRLPGLSDELKDFVAQCLQPDEAKRPRCAELLHHPWITRHCPPVVAQPVGTTEPPLRPLTLGDDLSLLLIDADVTVSETAPAHIHTKTAGDRIVAEWLATLPPQQAAAR